MVVVIHIVANLSLGLIGALLLLSLKIHRVCQGGTMLLAVVTMHQKL